MVGTLGRAIVPWLIHSRRRAYDTPEAARHDVSRRLRLAAEQLGATYIKLGQLLSTRPDLLPEPFIAELEHLLGAYKAEGITPTDNQILQGLIDMSRHS